MRRTVVMGLSCIVVGVGSLVLANSTPELAQLPAVISAPTEVLRLPTGVTPEILANITSTEKGLYRQILANSMIPREILPECPVSGPAGFFYRYGDVPEALKQQRIDLCWSYAVMPQPTANSMEKSTPPR